MGNVCCLVSDPSAERDARSKSTQSESSRACAAAEQELKKGTNRKFSDAYTVGKIIGHGAFAKVSVCTCTATLQQFAVKSLAKNYDDLHKQRQGAGEGGGGLASSGPRAPAPGASRGARQRSADAPAPGCQHHRRRRLA
jgi:hypothetical protein